MRRRFARNNRVNSLQEQPGVSFNKESLKQTTNLPVLKSKFGLKDMFLISKLKTDYLSDYPTLNPNNYRP